VGLGGQSLRSIEHTVCKVLGTEGVVTEEIIDSLYQECKDYRPDMLTVLDVVSPSYFLDDKPESNPVGVPCSRIEARYKLIVGRPSLKLNIINSISEQAKIEIAGILVSPLALGDVVLSDNEKDLGCALIGFGAGVTTITVYKGGKLASLSVVPFGGNLITKDITNLRVVESEAERLKITYGSAKADRDNDMTIQVSLADKFFKAAPPPVITMPAPRTLIKPVASRRAYTFSKISSIRASITPFNSARFSVLAS